MRWLKTSTNEDFITSFGVEAQYRENINVADLRRDWRTRNWGRVEQRLADDPLLDLAESMEANHGIPAGILYPFPDGLEPVDGHYRYAAAIDLHDATRIAGYVLKDVSVETAKKMALSANPRSTGKGPTSHDIRHAAYEFLDSGYSTKETAQSIGRAHKSIASLDASRRNARILEDQGFVIAVTGRNGVLAELDTLGNDSRLKCHVYETIEKAALSKDHAFKCIHEVAAQPKESRLVTSEAYRSQPEIQARINRGMKGGIPPVALLLAQMKGLRTTLLKNQDLTLSQPAEVQCLSTLREAIHDYTGKVLERSGA